MAVRKLFSWLSAHRKPIIIAGLAVVAYLAAINRAQALPWAFAALLVSTLATGILWPYWLLKRLSVVRQGPARAEEGEMIAFNVEIRNRGWLPRFMVEVVDHLPFVGTSNQAESSREKVLGVLAYVPGNKTSHFQLELLCEKRGYYQLGPVGLVSGFPLGLVDARLGSNGGVQTLTIYPDVFPILSLPLRGAPSQIHRGGYLLPEGAGSAEFSGIREYRRGDSPRHIHWPTTARLNELMVREYEPLASACLCIALDLSTSGNVGQGKQATFEYAVRIAASVARYGCTQNIRTRLVGQGAKPFLIPSGSGQHHYQTILDELAVVDSDGATPYADTIFQIALNCISGETVLVFLTAPDSRSTDILQALALLKARRANLFVVVFDRDSFAPAPTQPLRKTPGPDGMMGGLLELGAYCLPVRQGDDLVRLFNP
jgi:uncharacterized protein (DUF58 family)